MCAAPQAQAVQVVPAAALSGRVVCVLRPLSLHCACHPTRTPPPPAPRGRTPPHPLLPAGHHHQDARVAAARRGACHMCAGLGSWAGGRARGWVGQHRRRVVLPHTVPKAHAGLTPHHTIRPPSAPPPPCVSSLWHAARHYISLVTTFVTHPLVTLTFVMSLPRQPPKPPLSPLSGAHHPADG